MTHLVTFLQLTDFDDRRAMAHHEDGLSSTPGFQFVSSSITR